ncbi:ribonuclease E/G, partial [Prochlorococcus sp. AH-736-F09]|nr:ribonuclease E/G [Prochlorococcus sp. AH-736-F09]
NNFVRLKDSNKESEKKLNNKKTKAKQIKKISNSGEEKIQSKIELNTNSKDKSINKIKENNEILFTDKKDEIELKDELNNARKKRRRSSASIE